MFTAAGFTGPEMLTVLEQAYLALGVCQTTNGKYSPECALYNVAAPIFINAVRNKNPNAAQDLSGRLTIWTCQVRREVTGVGDGGGPFISLPPLTLLPPSPLPRQVNTMSSDNKHSISLGTSKWDSIEDLVHNVVASGSIPCFSIATQYTNFRGIGMIDGGYCNDFAQLCPKTPSKCVKFSTTFLGMLMRRRRMWA